jgi:hypothetical protein
MNPINIIYLKNNDWELKHEEYKYANWLKKDLFYNFKNLPESILPLI